METEEVEYPVSDLTTQRLDVPEAPAPVSEPVSKPVLAPPPIAPEAPKAAPVAPRVRARKSRRRPATSWAGGGLIGVVVSAVVLLAGAWVVSLFL